MGSSLSIIVKAGLIAGTLDIADALIFGAWRGTTPKIVFQYIASGLIGPGSFRDGFASVVLGAVLHYVIALIWTAVFYAASRRLSILYRRPVICGLLYGVIVYLFMNWVVLPLSRSPHPRNPVTLASRINGILALMFCLGLTVSLLVRRYSEEAAVKVSAE
jgi:hypothetical protein